MQWKKFFCVAITILPLNLLAQGPKVSNEEKQLALVNRNEEVIIAANTKVVIIDSSVALSKGGSGDKSNKGTVPMGALPKTVKESSVDASKTASLNKSGPTPRIIVENDKFKPVPLAGETDYFGTMNAYMMDYVKKYMNSNNRTLRVVNGRADGTFKTIDRILNTHSIPEELKYLAVIESALNKNALSPVGARGYWQFMATTARMMGLTVNKRQDDRTDLHKSTHAAAKYLSYLYDQLDDWLLVVAAYNSGPRPVVNAIKRTGKSDFWSIKSYLPKETQNHVMAFVATATIMERLNHFIEPGLPSDFDWSLLSSNMGAKGAKSAKFSHPLLSKFSEEEVKTMAIVRISKPLDLELVCNVLSVDRRKLGRWNYDYFDYIDTYKEGSTYNFRIPKEKLDTFIEKKDYLERTSAKM